MVTRTIEPFAKDLATKHPVLTVMGPRQSGKTTLCRAAFPDKPYLSLENPDTREHALRDPRGLLAAYPDGAVIDEVQRAPDLVSYLQGIVDERPRPGLFVLTGSRHFGLHEAVSQSLAGRTAILHLLPLGLDELRRFPSAPEGMLATLHAGGYPAIHDRRLPPAEWLADYVATYVERDVRQVLNVGDLVTFQTFLRLCAGRTAQLLNLSALAADCGVSHHTARAWMSVLEASFIVWRLPPLVATLRKRLVKMPKLHFYDTGLCCWLLGIESPGDLATHPLRGAIFESWVADEILKAHRHRRRTPRLSFYRDRGGLEVDAVLERGSALVAVETKSGATMQQDFLGGLGRFAKLFEGAQAREVERVLVYGGEQGQSRGGARVVAWREIDGVEWWAGGAAAAGP